MKIIDSKFIEVVKYIEINMYYSINIKNQYLLEIDEGIYLKNILTSKKEPSKKKK